MVSTLPSVNTGAPPAGAMLIATSDVLSVGMIVLSGPGRPVSARAVNAPYTVSPCIGEVSRTSGTSVWVAPPLL